MYLTHLPPPLTRHCSTLSRPSNAIDVIDRISNMTCTGIVRGVKLATTIFAFGATVLVKDAFIGLASDMQRDLSLDLSVESLYTVARLHARA